MRKGFLAVFVLMTLGLLVGCDNELKVNAEWKEVPVIYGIINPTAEYNYIRINRAFLNEEGSALDYARVSDSIQYDSLTVQLVERKNGIETNVIDLEKVDGDTIGLPKDEGVFSNSPNILYRTNYKFTPTSFTEDVEVDLVVINEISGKIYRSSTIIPGKVEVLSPFRFSNPKINFVDDDRRFVVFSYREGKYARMYDLVARFRYEVYPKGNPSDSRIDSVQWIIAKGMETKSLAGFFESQIVVQGDQFYNFLEQALPLDTSLERRPIDMGIYFYGGAEDLYTYQAVNRPSIGIVQKKPEFTNITNGLGIFSSSHKNSWDHVIIGDQMMESLIVSERMADYNFVK